jgi:hypothetical protein
MTEKVNFDNDWRFKDKLRDIIKKNVKTEPYEGDEVDKEGIVDDIITLLKSKEYSLLHHIKSK